MTAQAASEMPGALIGLVGGLGPAATIHYYRELVAEAARRDVRLRLVVTHADVTRVLDLAGRDDREGLATYLAERCAELEKAGAEVLAIGAVTPHLAIAELQRHLRSPIVDVVTAVGAEVERCGYRRVLLLGTRKVVESRLFGRLAQALPDLLPERVQQVHDLYVTIVREGAVSDALARELRHVAVGLVERERADAIVLAGTELALAPTSTWSGVPVVDAASTHIRAILDAAAR